MKQSLLSSWLGVSSTLAMTISSPSAHRRGIMLKLLSVLVLILTIGVGNAWGADETLTIQGNSITWGSGSGYKDGSGSLNTNGSTSIALTWVQTYNNSGIQMAKSGGGYIYSTSYPTTNNVIKSVTATATTNSANVYGSTDGSSWTSITSGATVTTSGYKYFKVSSASKYCVLSSISVVYTAGSSTPVDPTASFSNGTYTLEGDNLDLTSLWTSNSTGTVTYSVTNANGTGATCTSAGSFSATTAGTCTVQASQAATTGFKAITKTATITVREPVVCTYSEANSLSVGDEIYIVYESGNTKKQMNTATGTEDITDCADYKFTVVKGYNNENLALKNSDNKYLTWSSSTSCAMTATSLTSTSGSWTTITSNGHLVLKNVSSNRYLMYKH